MGNNYNNINLVMFECIFCLSYEMFNCERICFICYNNNFVNNINIDIWKNIFFFYLKVF